MAVYAIARVFGRDQKLNSHACAVDLNSALAHGLLESIAFSSLSLVHVSVLEHSLESVLFPLQLPSFLVTGHDTGPRRSFPAHRICHLKYCSILVASHDHHHHLSPVFTIFGLFNFLQ